MSLDIDFKHINPLESMCSGIFRKIYYWYAHHINCLAFQPDRRCGGILSEMEGRFPGVFSHRAWIHYHPGQSVSGNVVFEVVEISGVRLEGVDFTIGSEGASGSHCELTDVSAAIEHHCAWVKIAIECLH